MFSKIDKAVEKVCPNFKNIRCFYLPSEDDVSSGNAPLSRFISVRIFVLLEPSGNNSHLAGDTDKRTKIVLL